jgi:putative ABC transport system permease protein
VIRWSFIARMIARDARAYRRRFLVYAFSISLGIAALVGVTAFRDTLTRELDRQARHLLGADLVARSRHPLREESARRLESEAVAMRREVSLRSMAYFPAGGHSRLVQVLAVEEGFPVYGALRTEPADAAGRLHDGPHALLDDSLMRQFGVAVGDELRIGAARFTVSGRLGAIPGELPAEAMFAPRVYIPLRYLEDTRLVQPGSVVSFRYYLLLADPRRADAAADRLGRALADENIDLRTAGQRRSELLGGSANFLRFFHLAGFLALILGGLGLAGAIHAHIRQHLDSVAILRCLGAGLGEPFAIYLGQALLLGLAGSAAGALLGLAVQWALPRLGADLLPIAVPFAIQARAVGLGLGVGLLCALLFSLLPLLMVRRVSPLRAFRVDYEAPRYRRDPWRRPRPAEAGALVYALIAAGIAAFAISQTETIRQGLAFAGGVVGGALVIAGASRLLVRLARRRVSDRLPFVWRQGLANLYRPHNQTTALMLIVGVATFVLLSLSVAHQSLDRKLEIGRRPDQPTLVLIDIQPDQKDGVAALVRGAGLPVSHLPPMVPMRLHAIAGRPVAEWRRDTARPIPDWALRKVYMSTYRDTLSDTERIVAGQWTAPGAARDEPAPVSIEKGIAETLRVKLGDELVFDIQGVLLPAVIRSVRQVDWDTTRPNFYMVFPESVLRDAPGTYALFTRVGDADAQARLQRQTLEQFPNVSSVDISMILGAVRQLLHKVSRHVRLMSLFCLGTGLIVLAGAIHASRYQRLRESVLLQTLGAERRQIRAILLVEYFLVGWIGAFTGALLAVAGGWAVARYALATPAVIRPALFLASPFAVALLTLLVGWLNSRGLGRQPPLEAFRRERMAG